MVCQGASQSRFRALKHMNGIAGKATIIVRVIACFQPLQDCQTTSSREYYNPKNFMFAPVEYKTSGLLPATTNLGLNGPGFCCFPIKGLACEANGSWVPPLTPSEYISEQTSLFRGARVDVLTSTNGAPSPEKKFLIFDKCGNETRLIDSSSLFPQSATQTSQLVVEDQPNKRERVLNEKYDIPEENGSVDEGGEMHEDTDEIDALLYSDDEDFDYDYDDEMSTGHSPSANQDHGFDEVSSFGRSTKRQKTLDGGHNEPPFLSTKEDRYPSNETIYDGELVCSSNEGSFSPTMGGKRVRKDKIRDTLRVLKSIVPGLKGKDPVIVLDEAINYLKRLKSNAKTISIEDPDGSSCYGPSKMSYDQYSNRTY